MRARFESHQHPTPLPGAPPSNVLQPNTHDKGQKLRFDEVRESAFLALLHPLMRLSAFRSDVSEARFGEHPEVKSAFGALDPPSDDEWVASIQHQLLCYCALRYRHQKQILSVAMASSSPFFSLSLAKASEIPIWLQAAEKRIISHFTAGRREHGWGGIRGQTVRTAFKLEGAFTETWSFP